MYGGGWKKSGPAMLVQVDIVRNLEKPGPPVETRPLSVKIWSKVHGMNRPEGWVSTTQLKIIDCHIFKNKKHC